MKRYLWPLACILCLGLGYALAHLPGLRYDFRHTGNAYVMRIDRVTGEVCEASPGVVASSGPNGGRSVWMCVGR